MSVPGRFSDAQRSALLWLAMHPGRSAIVRDESHKDAINSLIFATPKIVEVYSWSDGDVIASITTNGREMLKAELPDDQAATI